MPFWESTPFWGIAGLIGGAVISALFFLIGKSKKRLHYQRTTTQLITEQMISVPTLEVTIDNTTIKSLTSTKIEFYNAGNQVIYPEDFAPLEPLEIKVTKNSFDLRKCTTVTSKYQNCNPRMETTDEDKEALNVKFDFLRPRQTFSVTVLHDGKLSILGDLTDGKVLELEKSDYSSSRAIRFEYILFSAVLFLLTIYLCWREQVSLSLSIMSPAAIGCAILLLIALVMSPQNYSRIKKSLLGLIDRLYRIKYDKRQ